MRPTSAFPASGLVLALVLSVIRSGWAEEPLTDGRRDGSSPVLSASSNPPFTRAAAEAEPTGPVLLQGGDLGCGDLLMNATIGHDGYGWQYGGVVPPEYGAWAECYSGEYEVCSAVFRFGQIGNQSDQTMDVYLWDDNAGEPGAVLCFLPGVEPGPISYHPVYNTHVFPLSGCCVEGDWWVGWWPNWPGQAAGWFMANDLEGPGGCPRTKIAPGLGYPTGWQDPSIVWGPTQAMWIGAEVRECAVPVTKSSWGGIKALYGSGDTSPGN